MQSSPQALGEVSDSLETLPLGLGCRLVRLGFTHRLHGSSFLGVPWWFLFGGIGSMVVPFFGGLYLGSYEVIPNRSYNGACGKGLLVLGKGLWRLET